MMVAHQVDPAPRTRVGVAVLLVAAVGASGMPAALVDERWLRVAIGVTITLALFALAAVARRVADLRALREAVLVLAALSVFGWASAVISAVPVVAAWLSAAPVPLAFLAVNAMKLTSIAVLVGVVVGRGWSRRRLLLQVGDPLAPAVGALRWPPVAVAVMLVVGALFLLELPPTAFEHLPGLVAWAPVVLAGAVVNALAEELLYRHALVAALRPLLGVLPAALLSSAVFGLAHTTGTPGGVSGVLFTAAFGLVCAAAMLQTRGMVWNTAIHVAGDVAAVSALYLAASMG